MRCPAALCAPLVSAALLASTRAVVLTPVVVSAIGCGEGAYSELGTARASVGPEGGAVALPWASFELEPGAVASAVEITLRPVPAPKRRGAVGRALDVTAKGGFAQPPLLVVDAPASEPRARLRLAFLQPEANKPGATQWIPFDEAPGTAAADRLHAKVTADFDKYGGTLTIAPVLTCGSGEPCPAGLDECRAGVCQ